MSSLFQGLVANGLVPVGLSPIAGAVAHYIAGVGISPRVVKNYLPAANSLFNSWNKSLITVVDGVADPYGGTKAATVTATANSAEINVVPVAGVAGNYVSAIWVRRRSGSGAINVIVLTTGSMPITNQLSSVWIRFAIPVAPRLSTEGLALGVRIATAGDSVDIAYAQPENIDGAVNQSPSEDIPPGTTAYFYTTNGNTVVNNVVIGAPGVPLNPLTVDRWQDQSGFDHPLLQATPAKQPINLPYSGTVYGWLPGTISQANSFSTPDAPANQLTGNIDLRGRVAANDWTPGGLLLTIVSKWAGPGNRSWLFQINNTGRLQLVASNNGTTLVTFVSTVNPTVSDGQDFWVRATLVVDNGAAGRTVVFYTSPDGSAWTPLGDPVTIAGVGLFAGTAPVAVGIQNLVTDPFIGKIYRAQIRNGINGPVVVDFNPGDAAVPVGRNWLLNSENYTALTWQLNNLALTPNAIPGPDGYRPATLCTSTAAGYAYLNYVGAELSGKTVYAVVKAGVGAEFTIDTKGSAPADIARFNLVSGFVVSAGANNVSATMEPVGLGFYLCTVTRGSDPSTAVYFGHAGTSLGDSFYICAAQINSGSVALPYVRAEGVPADWNSSTTNEPWTINATGAKQAQLVQKSSVLFDGVAHFLKTLPFTLNQPLTIVARLRQVTWTANDYFWDGNTLASVIFRQQNGGVPPEIGMFAGGSVGPTSDLIMGKYGVVTCVYAGASSVLRVDNFPATFGDVGAQNAGAFNLGCNSSPAGYSNFQIEELAIIPRALTPTEINNIVDYMNGAVQAFFRGVRLATSTSFSFVPESGQARSFIEGIAVTQTDGSIIYTTDAPQVIPSGGLGRSVNGAVSTSTLAAEVFHQGVPLRADGRLCIVIVP